MPFTLAHPSIVLFLNNKYFNLSALILGAMAPDYMYFILFKPSSNIGHTFLGCLILNLPLCFLLNFIFYYYIKKPLILALPKTLSKKYTYLISYKNKIRNLKEFFIFTYSALIGMATHIFWDSFTHNTGYFVERIEFLRKTFNIVGFKIPIFKIFQHGSTILGMLIIIFYLYKIRGNKKDTNIKINKLRFYSIILFILIGTLITIKIFFYYRNERFEIGASIVTIINGIFLGYLFGSIDFYRKNNTVVK